MSLPPLPGSSLYEATGDIKDINTLLVNRNAMRAFYAEGVRAGLEQAAVIALKFATCGCNGVHGRCNEDDQPKAISAAIRAAAKQGGQG